MEFLFKYISHFVFGYHFSDLFGDGIEIGSEGERKHWIPGSHQREKVN